ncbi:MAG: phosphoenolpyruvate carboxykinase (ATP) [Bryobacteraceae bacterium]|nr:phosphoenolpyruvate carboxykinase (ATP) [Solibacteraceae bacterium]MCL4842792.1 phosphoenolpyruvate carboxykinase (ATP) [Bryobacteraceae bacterium]MCO5351034.1 phosphoenolpyruvate carboxykinase (ATP) [Bryobacteraceae bacterium]
MNTTGINPSRFGLEQQGITQVANAWWNLGTAQLMERALQSGEGLLSGRGALVVRTGQFTGRSPKDKFIVRDATTENSVAWGAVNQPLDPAQFAGIWNRVLGFLQGKDVMVEDLYAGADPDFRLPIRVVVQRAWHGLFARQLFIRPQRHELEGHRPDFTLVFAPEFQCDPSHDGTRSETCIAVDFTRRLVLILGTSYAGELKKSVFTILNHLLPERGVMPMHCSANMGDHGRVALFFGLSGTGKTTLSADRHRRLIGDDEHGWSDKGVFNFEGGCYAKCIRLSRDAEPQIYNAIRYGVVLENVMIDPWTRRLDFNDDEFTENTRAAYRVHFIENAQIPGVGGHPSDVVFLTADAFGVLPPIARLTPEQAMYHFLSGYTAKLAGTERGLGKEPQAVFSACFGEPFLPRHPMEYARLLGEKLRRHKARVWLINTGWTGGAFGTGQRMNLAYTRAMVTAAIEGELSDVPTNPHPVFQVLVPEFCPGVPNEVLDARGQWADKVAYDEAARDLARRFRENFGKKFGEVDSEVASAGPRGE